MLVKKLSGAHASRLMNFHASTAAGAARRANFDMTECASHKASLRMQTYTLCPIAPESDLKGVAEEPRQPRRHQS